MGRYPSVEQQQEWADHEGFELSTSTCYWCGERMAEGDDCRSEHYTTWLDLKVLAAETNGGN